MSVDYILVHTESAPSAPDDEFLKLDDLAAATGLHADLVRRLWNLGLFEAERQEGSDPCFSVGTVFRVRRALRLRRDLGISWMSLGLVADLLERIDALESRVRWLESHEHPETILDEVA